MWNNKVVEEIFATGEPLLDRVLGPGKGAWFISRSRERIAALEQTAPKFRNIMNAQLFGLATPVVAMYEVLRQDLAMDKDPALEVLQDMVHSTFRRFGASPLWRALLSAAFRVAPIRNLGLRSAYSANEPLGFRFAPQEEDGALLAFDVHECAIVKYAKAHGVPEIVPIICRLDDIMAEHMSGLDLRRNGTIGMGADKCDFRYFKKA